MKQLLILTCGMLGLSSLSLGADGKQAFLDNSCDRCHAVSSHDIEATVKSERMRGPDLKDVGKERDAEWLQKYVMKEVDIEGKAHRSSFKGSEEDLKAIAEWLSKLDGT